MRQVNLSVDEVHLSLWFVKIYIGQCAQLCPTDISKLFHDVSTNMKLQTAVSEIINLRLNTLLYDMWYAFNFAEQIIAAEMNIPLTVRSCVSAMKELTKIDKRLSAYITAVVLLHVARKISRKGCNNELLDIVLVRNEVKK